MKRSGLASGAVLGALAWLLAATPAMACSIMPPPPVPIPAAGTPQANVDALAMAWGKAHALKYSEELRDWAMRRQVGLFDEAKSLVLARYDHEALSGEDRFAILKPVRWLRGSGRSSELRISMTQPPPCGQMTAHDAYYGKPGEVFLVYLSGNALDKGQVLEAFALDRIIEPRTIAALTTG